MQNQTAKQNSSQTGLAQKPVLPEVRYHPSISTRTTQKTRSRPAEPLQTRTNAKMVQENQNHKKTSSQTGPAQKPDLPQVRYHPSIHAPDARVSTRTSQTQRTRSGPETPPQKNQNPKEPGPDVADEAAHGDGAPPRPEPVPPDLGARLDRSVVEQVEVLTRGQSLNEDWFAWRKNRITASVAHCIAHSRFANGKSQAPPLSYLARITGEGPRVQTRAMSWGVRMEAEAVRRYQQLKSAASGHQVEVRDCGLFVDARRPWLAASPDGIVTDGRTGQWLLCLEVKCPFKHRHRRLEDACREDPNFCLQVRDGPEPGRVRPEPGRVGPEPPSYHLKTSHSYFTQIQCQLAVTGLDRAELVVFTLKETAIVPVTFDPERWEDTRARLEKFYRDAVLPHLRRKAELTGPRGPEL